MVLITSITIQDGSGRYYDRQGLVHVLNGE